MARRTIFMLSLLMLCQAAALPAAETGTGGRPWYKGDARCPPPKDDGRYSAPYSAIDHRFEFPTFHGADKPGWSCSYQRKDGVIVQYGDSRTPQEQWLAVWGQDDRD